MGQHRDANECQHNSKSQMHVVLENMQTENTETRSNAYEDAVTYLTA